MTAAAKQEKTVSVPVAWENPLIPNKKLRSLYVAMVELRLLDEHIGKLPARARPGARQATIRGEEGCRVSTTFDLKPGDLTSEVSKGLATDFLRGAKLSDLLRRAHQTGKNKATATESDSPGQLPAMAAPIDRLHMALGAASVLKAAKKRSIAVVYLHSDEISVVAAKPVLRFAAEQVLPIIFVVLPAAPGSKGLFKPGQLGLASSKFGVPGIPVDAADPVALFRVAQESMLRARAGGGPVLMECIPFNLAGTKSAPSDPIVTMRESLLHRKIVDEAWLQGVETRFVARLKSASQSG